MAAWQVHKASLCPGCGHPRATAWHPDNDGWFEEANTVTCHPCTVQRGREKDGVREPVEYSDVVDTRDYQSSPLPLAR